MNTSQPNTPGAVLTPDQLPSKNAQFIAYGQPTRIADPLGGEDPITIRPQTYVRYYRGVKIAKLETPNEDTLHVQFDPESVGLSKAIGAYMNTNDPAAQYVRERFEAGDAVDVGLEWVRRKKEKNGDKAEIAPYAPIHALRGATSADGTGDNLTMMAAAGNNIRNVLAVVNGRRTASAVSDPSEWALLTDNRKGDLPPRGWRFLTDRDDWTRVGAIVAKDDADPQQSAAPQGQGAQQGAGFDPNALSKMISHAVREALRDADREQSQAEQAAHGNPTNRPSGRTPGEPKPWVPWAARDVVNLGSYITASEGYAFRWGYKHLRDSEAMSGAAAEDLTSAAVELATAQQSIADRVLARAYDGRVKADRSDASFKEASLWVRFIIENQHPFGTDPDFDLAVWSQAVEDAATALYTDAADRTAAHLNDTATSSQSAASAGSASSANREGGEPRDRSHHVKAFLQLLENVWGSADRLRDAAKSAQQQGIMGETVWANPGAARFSTEQFDGAREITLGNLTHIQYGILTKDQGAGSAAPADEPPTDDTPPEDDHSGDGEGPSGAALTPNGQSAPASPTQNRGGRDEQSPNRRAATPNGNGGRSAQQIAVDLSRATTEQQIATLFSEVRSGNLLTTEVAVRDGAGHFGFAPVPPNTEGATSMALGAVFDELGRRIANAGSQSPAADGADAPAHQEQTADDDSGTTVRTAQEIAEAAEAASTVQEVEALSAEMLASKLGDEQVTIKRTTGPLGGFMSARLQRVSRQASTS